jgi:hypothetical protein
MCSWVVHNILTPPPTAIGEPQAALFFGASALMHGHIHTIDTLSYLLGDPPIARVRGEPRARSHCRFAPPLIHFTPESLTYSVHLFLKRQCDPTPGELLGADAACDFAVRARARPRARLARGWPESWAESSVASVSSTQR